MSNLNFFFSPANLFAVILGGSQVRLHIRLELPAAAVDSSLLFILADTH